MMARQKIIIIAGPNGAGKTTFAREFLPNEAACIDFINADLIAAGLSPFSPGTAAMRAGRLMLEEIETRIGQKKCFVFETTLSSRSYARRIPGWQALGYRVTLVFLSLPNPDIALTRIATRVAQGGHNIAEAVVRRRFRTGLQNFVTVYKDIVDQWILYDNSDRMPVLLDWGEKR